MDGIHNLKRPEGSHRSRKRVGRGVGSGLGKTSGYGHKGSKARAGHHGPGGSKPHFEGGQMPLQRRVPKRGFTNTNRIEYQVVNLFQLNELEETEVTLEVLAAQGLIGHTTRRVKVLGAGELTRSVTVSAHRFSKSAREKIESAGGTVQELG
jgi:large subunit ribosomal protein L15